MSGTFRIVPLLPSPVKVYRNGRRKQHTVSPGLVKRGHESDSGTGPRALGGLEGSPAGCFGGTGAKRSRKTPDGRARFLPCRNARLILLYDHNT